MKKKMIILFLAGLATLITGFVLTSNYEGSGTTWIKAVPTGYEVMIKLGTFICLVTGIFLGTLKKSEQ